MQQRDNPDWSRDYDLQTPHKFSAFRQCKEQLRRLIFTRQKCCWGKSGSSSGEGGETTCAGTLGSAKARTDGCTGRGTKTLPSPSKVCHPDHEIYHSKHRAYLFCVLLSDLAAAFFWWWFKSVPQFCYRCPGSPAVPQRLLLSFSLFCICRTPGNFSGTLELKSNLTRVKIQEHKWKCN